MLVAGKGADRRAGTTPPRSTPVVGGIGPRWNRCSASRLGPGGHLEDLLQDTLEAVVVAFPSFRCEAAVSTWMARIAARTAYHQMHRPEARRRAPLDPAGRFRKEALDHLRTLAEAP